ncbi:hypothetical protein MHBO_000518 [Bonamia ostreae]|uniref:Phlebovirus glycoprotein G2 fusion domain-containing protein n=1 Tax=Bonamia ostreae TaxID=126728 RepID=A0ABV2AFY1_9EUKA
MPILFVPSNTLTVSNRQNAPKWLKRSLHINKNSKIEAFLDLFRCAKRMCEPLKLKEEATTECLCYRKADRSVIKNGKVCEEWAVRPEKILENETECNMEPITVTMYTQFDYERYLMLISETLLPFVDSGIKVARNAVIYFFCSIAAYFIFSFSKKAVIEKLIQLNAIRFSF